MPFFRLRRLFAALIVKTDFTPVVALTLGYFLVSYFLLYISNEQSLIGSDFFYWIIVTASTVGYGDLSPSTQYGKITTALWIIPAGLSVFAFIIGKFGYLVVDILNRRKKGLLMSGLSSHCIIVGWNGTRTERLIELLKAGDKQNAHKILLCSSTIKENPLPNLIEFVAVDSYTHSQSMNNARVDEASKIILDLEDDSLTLTAALYCNSKNSDCHKTAYVENSELILLMQHHCPNVEIIPPVSVEMMAISSIYPGASSVQKQLLDSTVGTSQHSIKWSNKETVCFDELLNRFKESHNAIVIGASINGELILNPASNQSICNGDELIYIASKPIKVSSKGI